MRECPGSSLTGSRGGIKIDLEWVKQLVSGAALSSTSASSTLSDSILLWTCLARCLHWRFGRWHFATVLLLLSSELLLNRSGGSCRTEADRAYPALRLLQGSRRADYLVTISLPLPPLSEVFKGRLVLWCPPSSAWIFGTPSWSRICTMNSVRSFLEEL